MTVAEGRDDDQFDFSDFILANKQFMNSSRTQSDTSKTELNFESEVQTSYLLVNALLNLLIKKGIINSHEVQNIVLELHGDYLRKKGSRGNGTG
ncbi:hypothetical protein KC480_05760 [Bacillus velezensis]|uniref:hypothetical protein n=1 Tax=Bacillus velezensis TaxID=492670 RepID=UPI001E577FBD|nr:hypothetical protein [Bacillus velezensis]MCD7911030.1 hypothetical protein [Bacillus velezensis]